MDYSEYEVEDFLMDPGFVNYCLGRDEADKAFWEQWLLAHPEKYEILKQAREFYLMLNGNHAAGDFAGERAQFQASLDRHFGETSAAAPALRRLRGRRQRYFAGALGIIALISLFAARLFWSPTPPIKQDHPKEVAEASNAGERKSFQLPDGTKVMLNASSKLTVSGDFNSASREVTLEGEAFFDVARLDSRPFIIHTRPMDIRVLGTSFNVKVYSDDKFAETTLLNGAIKVTVKGGNAREVLLHPNEKIVVPNPGRPADSARMGISRVPAAEFKIRKILINPRSKGITEIYWTENRLAFNDNSLEEIAAGLERWYRINIRFEDDSVRQFRYTASFDKKTIGQVLDALKLSRPFQYRLEGDSAIVIKSITRENQ